ncbi:hypothetical protein V2J09_000528, partial [Rumex salicifolius]
PPILGTAALLSFLAPKLLVSVPVQAASYFLPVSSPILLSPSRLAPGTNEPIIYVPDPSNSTEVANRMRKPSSSSDAGGADDGAAGRSDGGGAKSMLCCSKVGLKKGPWTPEEDDVLANYIKTEGEGRWRTLPKRADLLRCGKSCRLRWMNYLRPSVKRGQIAPDEEDLILRLHRLLGNRSLIYSISPSVLSIFLGWSLIAGRIPGRTDNEIKNYWNTHLSKKLISQGIDPRTHKPLDVDLQFRNSKSIISKDLTKLFSPKHYTPPNPKFASDEPNNSTGVEIADAQIAPHLQTKSREILFYLARF